MENSYNIGYITNITNVIIFWVNNIQIYRYKYDKKAAGQNHPIPSNTVYDWDLSSVILYLPENPVYSE